MSATGQSGSGSGITAETWASAQSSPDFVNLRKRLRNFVFPVSVLFLAWYLVYVLLADYAHGFMSTKLVGNINLGLVLGLLQFVSTFAITTLYVRYANRNLDPLAEKIRLRVEGEADSASAVDATAGKATSTTGGTDETTKTEGDEE